MPVEEPSAGERGGRAGASMAANHPRHCRQQLEQRSAKRQKRSRRAPFVSGAELLTTRLLSLSPAQLLTAPPELAPLPPRFSSARQYYSSMQELVVEEGRAIVAEGLQQCAGRPIWVRLCEEQPQAERGSGGALQTIRVRVELQRQDMQWLRDCCRPGGVWLLETDAGRQGGAGRRGKAPPLAECYRSGRGQLASIDGRQALDGEGVLGLEVSAAGAAALRHACSSSGGQGRVAAWHVGSVLAEQRMCDVCQRRPAPPYMFQILGERTREHIVFSASSDEEDSTESETSATADGPPAASGQEQEPTQLDGSHLEAAWRELNGPQRR